MNPLRPAILPLVAIASTLLSPQLHAVTEAEAASGQALVKRYADSIVSIELVVTIRISLNDKALPPRENKVDVNGTIISPTGLTVSALSIIDPRGNLEAARAAQAGNGQKVEIGETEFKDVKLRLANGTEVPSAVVLKDPDLNLIFVAPLPSDSAPARTFPYVSLDKEAPATVLGNYFFVSRAAKILQRVPVVHTAYIVGIVEKPRRMFLLNDQGIGIPVFDSSGVPLGMSTQYLDNGRPVGLVVLPPSDVAELAKQAAAIKPEEKAEKQDAAAAPVGPVKAVNAADGDAARRCHSACQRPGFQALRGPPRRATVIAHCLVTKGPVLFSPSGIRALFPPGGKAMVSIVTPPRVCGLNCQILGLACLAFLPAVSRADPQKNTFGVPRDGD